MGYMIYGVQLSSSKTSKSAHPVCSHVFDTLDKVEAALEYFLSSYQLPIGGHYFITYVD